MLHGSLPNTIDDLSPVTPDEQFIVELGSTAPAKSLNPVSGGRADGQGFDKAERRADRLRGFERSRRLAAAADGSAEIRGTKWEDRDGDGLRDVGERGIEGRTIYLDLNENGRFDADEPQATTNADGEYRLTGLEPGTYSVAEIQADTWEQTFPPAVPGPVRTTRVALGLNRPVFVTAPPGDTDRLFIVEQHTGRIRILDLDSGQIRSAPFLDINGLSRGNEQGLLGLAFHPEYASNGTFYVNFNDSRGDTQIVRYLVSSQNADVANANSAFTILSIDQPFSNHNGGWIGFGPDGYLYISTGDGGSGDDPGNRAQDITNQLLGKILRIDINRDQFPADAQRNYAVPSSNPFVGRAGDDEIWAYGLRNPWRMSFDRETGDLYIGDVGQRAREEISFQPAASEGGENYGWRVMEGFRCFDNSQTGSNPPCGHTSLVPPLHDYPRSSGFSVTGGYVYRGPIDELDGKYFFADYGSARIWSIEHDGTTVTEFLEWTDTFVPDVGQIDEISAFGEDAFGNLYVVDLGGEVFKLVQDVQPGTHRVTLADGQFVESVDFGNHRLGEEPSRVVARHVFYNRSVWDGNDPAAGPGDDLALAPDPSVAVFPRLGKTALLPGQTASFQNYTSYVRGINGIMIDVAQVPAPNQLDASHFEFRVGNSVGSAQWEMAPTPQSITVRPGAGIDGSDRITIIWEDGAIVNQWLRVQIFPTAVTGLVQSDVHFWGNAVGETGDAASHSFVDGTDFAGVRDRASSQLVGVHDPYDVNRDGRIDSQDLRTVLDHTTHFLSDLERISGAHIGAALASVP